MGDMCSYHLTEAGENLRNDAGSTGSERIRPHKKFGDQTSDRLGNKSLFLTQLPSDVSLYITFYKRIN